MSDILEEANQDYTHQKRVQLFKKALPLVVGVTIVLIIGISINNWYQGTKLEKKEKRTTLLIDAINMDITQKAMKDEILISLSKEKDGISDLASLEIVADAIADNNISKALEILEVLYNNGSTSIAKNLAKIQYVGILLDKDELTTEETNKIQSLLVGIDKTQALYGNAQIYTALFNIKINNINAAKDIVKRMLNEGNTSESIKSQAESILSYLNEKGQ